MRLPAEEPSATADRQLAAQWLLFVTWPRQLLWQTRGRVSSRGSHVASSALVAVTWPRQLSWQSRGRVSSRGSHVASSALVAVTWP
eukprot:1975719-Prymnesium_polylepis.2